LNNEGLNPSTAQRGLEARGKRLEVRNKKQEVGSKRQEDEGERPKAGSKGQCVSRNSKVATQSSKRRSVIVS
jgi:hypothetical protein